MSAHARQSDPLSAAAPARLEDGPFAACSSLASVGMALGCTVVSTPFPIELSVSRIFIGHRIAHAHLARIEATAALMRCFPAPPSLGPADGAGHSDCIGPSPLETAPAKTREPSLAICKEFGLWFRRTIQGPLHFSDEILSASRYGDCGSPGRWPQVPGFGRRHRRA